MNVNPAPRRRIRYIDHAIQRSMLVALVATEMLLVIGSVALLDIRLHDLLEAQLYRIHFTSDDLGVGKLLGEGLILIGAFTVVNVIALVMAEVIWAGYVQSVLHGFRETVVRISRLDFRPTEPGAADHEVLQLAEGWRAKEFARMERIRADLASLEQLARDGAPDPEIRRGMADLLARLPAAEPVAANPTIRSN